MIKTTPKINTRKAKQNKRNQEHKPNKLYNTIMSINWLKLRFQIVAGIFLIIWSVLWCRAFYLQIIIGKELRTQVEKQHSITQLVEAKRGSIFDRNGQVLARSVEVRSVYAHPRHIIDPVYAAKELAPILKISEEKLVVQFQQDRSFIWIKRKIDDATSLAVQNTGIAGVGLSKEYERVYPYKHLAGQLLGFVGVDNDGLEGIEYAFNDKLIGKSKRQIIPRDIAGRALYNADDSEAKGSDIKLTLDVQIQFIAEEVIAEAVETYDARWGGVLVADPQTGDILAWAQYPFFNPNNFRNYNANIYRNRLANDALEPGSTFKPLVIAAGLEAGVIKPDSHFFAENGVWKIDHIKIGKDKHSFTIGDDGRSYGDMTAEEILVHSSNIGMAKIAQALGSKTLRDFILEMGFGKTTGIGINESKGIVHRLRDWSEADLLSIGFGQSIAVTGLQLMQAYNILVNDGERASIRLIMGEGEYSPNVSERGIMSRKNAREVLRMMESVVDGNGTGKRARIKGVRVAGKTGTAEKASSGEGGYGEDRMASFIGIIPADSPRYIILTILDEPKVESYGGVIAAPVFQKIGVRTMAYSGDLPGVVFPSEETLNARSNNRHLPNNTEIIEGLVPNVTNLTLRSAMEIFGEVGIIPKIIGEGSHVVQQAPTAGTALHSGIVQNTDIQDLQNTQKINSHENTLEQDTKHPQEAEKSKLQNQEFILYLANPIVDNPQNTINLQEDSKAIQKNSSEKNANIKNNNQKPQATNFLNIFNKPLHYYTLKS